MHVLSLVNDILDLSKIDAGKFKLHERPTDLCNALKNAVSIISGSPVAKSQRVRVLSIVDPLLHVLSVQNTQEGTCEACGGKPSSPRGPCLCKSLTFLLDETRLLQLASNFLSNAVKFTTDGDVALIGTLEDLSMDESSNTKSETTATSGSSRYQAEEYTAGDQRVLATIALHMVDEGCGMSAG